MRLTIICLFLRGVRSFGRSPGQFPERFYEEID